MFKLSDILRGVAGYSVVPVVSALITIFIIPIVSFVFPAEEYGKINLFYTVGALATNVLLLGLDHAFIRFYYEPPKLLNKESMFVIAFIIGFLTDVAAIIMILCLFPGYVSDLLFGELDYLSLISLGVYSFALIVFRLLNTVSRMEGRVLEYNIQSISQNLITRAGFVVMAWYSTDYQYGVLAMTVGMLVISIFFFIRQRKFFLVKKKICLNRQATKVMMLFGIPCMLNSLVLVLNSSIGKFVLSYLGMMDAVGILAIASVLASAFSVIPQAFNTFWSPFVYKNHKTEKIIISQMHDYIMIVSIVIVVAIVLLQDVLFLIVGDSYSSAQSYFMLLMLAPIQSLICETTSYGIMLKNKPYLLIISTVLGLVICFVLTIYLASFLGALGAAAAVAFSSCFIGCLTSILGCRLYNTVLSIARTVMGAAGIIIICLMNTIVFNDVFTRSVICIACLIIELIIYRKQIYSIVSNIKSPSI